ncbi:enamine deaminase RidA (YjgF/YER057c/UK114 family) [Gemmobacter caeni]|uniref:Enamine deaminase RidA (YjgF/YER057c/UK114 family) n=2 Tax=Gemmobacter caeni TaxID=589035 RepID=A0A2T6B066_9RHOB|nr:enamine deaminase RidA (YjgF/YER057c/UK114 family) [Gemmobacter caeni]TWJ00243.1 enamine deaminase RidA (YjgF/YER057c/UK114 family) [Gemmobacter caeni]
MKCIKSLNFLILRAKLPRKIGKHRGQEQQEHSNSEDDMETREINPWSWQEGFGFAHGREVSGATRILTLSGQCATDATGAPQHKGDMAAQLALCVANLGEVLAAAGMTYANVTGIRVLTTDMDATLANWGTLIGPFAALGHRPASTLAGVTRLFSPDLLVEVEATACA